MRTYNPIPIEPLETDRLLLRPSEMSDAPRTQELFANINLLRYMATAIPWPYPETGAVDYLTSLIAKIDARETYAWTILEKSNLAQGLIGHISLTPDAEEDSRGFWIGEPYWGRGYMSEAVLAVTDFAFGPLGMTTMSLNNAVPNKPSHRMKEKAGARIVAFEDRDYIGGRFKAVRWELTAEQWAAHRANFFKS